MKLRLKVKGLFVPYGGGYFIKDPLTGVNIRGTTFNQLLENAATSRIANNAPIGLGFEDEVETWVCQAYPAECVNKDSDSVSARTLNYNDIIVGTRVMLSFKAAGSPIVPQEEAERRANICAKCPLNNPFRKPCTGICGTLLSLVQSVTGSHKTSQDANLHACGICGCFLISSVHLPVEIQWRPLSEEQKNQYRAMAQTNQCWKIGD